MLSGGIRAEGGFSCLPTSEDRKCSSTHRACAGKGTFSSCGDARSKIARAAERRQKPRAILETSNMGRGKTHNDGCQWHTSNFCVRQVPAAPVFGRPAALYAPPVDVSTLGKHSITQKLQPSDSHSVQLTLGRTVSRTARCGATRRRNIPSGARSSTTVPPLRPCLVVNARAYQANV